FAELAREWPEHFRDGRFEIRSSVAPNLVIWVGVSETCADALEKIKNRTVAYEPASSPLVYLIDGCTLNYPLAKAKTRKALHSYKRPHRVPTVLRPIERARPSQLMDTETMGDVIDLPDARGKVFATGRSTR